VIAATVTFSGPSSGKTVDAYGAVRYRDHEVRPLCVSLKLPVGSCPACVQVTTRTVAKSLSPRWNQLFSFDAVDLSDELTLLLFDAAVGARSSCIGRVRYLS
jgi:hypothetical protein